MNRINAMKISPLAGKPAPPGILVNVPRLITAYYAEVPDPSVPEQRVAFGTSGHRGSAFESSFNEQHVLAITQAICEYRKAKEIDGPLYLGIDTHALSEPAAASAIEVLAANGVATMLATNDEYTPTPAISHAILAYNKGRKTALPDGIVVTPSHNPPYNGGLKYRSPNARPADTDHSARSPAAAKPHTPKPPPRVPRRPASRPPPPAIVFSCNATRAPPHRGSHFSVPSPLSPSIDVVLCAPRPVGDGCLFCVSLRCRRPRTQSHVCAHSHTDT